MVDLILLQIFIFIFIFIYFVESDGTAGSLNEKITFLISFFMDIWMRDRDEKKISAFIIYTKIIIITK